MKKTDMIYGTRAVMEAIHSGRAIDKIIIQSGLNNDLVKSLIGLAREHQVPVSFVPQEKLRSLSSANHQGVLCMLSPVPFASVDDLIHLAYSEGREPFLLVLDHITDVRNFGGIVRTAECVGVDGVIIGDKGNAPVSADAVKTSAGALHHIPVCREKDLKKTIQFLRENGIRIIALTEKGESNIFKTDMKGPIALILGSEDEGISDFLLKAADELVHIPMKGKIQSLNVSVASGIALYEVARQRGG